MVGRGMTIAPAATGTKPPAARIYETIFELLSSQAEQRPEAIAIETAGDTVLTYGEVLSRTTALMQALYSRGVSRESRVAIVLPNGADLAVGLLAISAMATSVPLNPIYRRDEYEAYFAAIRVTHLLTLQDFPTEIGRASCRERGS